MLVGVEGAMMKCGVSCTSVKVEISWCRVHLNSFQVESKLANSRVEIIIMQTPIPYTCNTSDNDGGSTMQEMHGNTEIQHDASVQLIVFNVPILKNNGPIDLYL